MEVFGLTDTGKVRKENQDTFIIERFDEQDACLCAVLDGMGGARGGKVASRLGAETFVAHVRTLLSGSTQDKPETVILEAADLANIKVLERSNSDADCFGMGTTLCGAMIAGDSTVVLNLGDSRAYLVSDGELTRITRDHSYVEDMVRLGNLTEAQARNHPRKNLITRALGIDTHAECDLYRLECKSGDALVLCSDGLSNELTDSEILSVVQNGGSAEDICRGLLEEALCRRAADNITVIIYKY